MLCHRRLASWFVSLFSLAASGCVVPVESDLGEAASPIVGGTPATQEQIYSTVSLTDASDGFTVCSGTLIAPTVVATAAHCVVTFANEKSTQITGQRQPSEIIVVAGALDADTPAPEQKYKVASLAYHKGFSLSTALDADGLSTENDIAVLLLQQPITSLPSVPVLSMDQLDTTLQQGTPLTITGYGIHNIENQFTGTLYVAQTPYQRRNKVEFLVGGNGNPDGCTDDSGSAAYISVDGTMVAAGIHSRSAVLGAGGQGMCGQGGVYTILAAYDSWLRDNAGGAYPPSSGLLPNCKCRLSDGPAPSRPGLWFGLGLPALLARRRRGGR